MPKQKQTIATTSQSTVYYVGLVVQRVSLLLAVASTLILWATLISSTHGFMIANSLQNVQFINFAELNNGIGNEISQLTSYAVVLSVLAVIVTLAFLKLPRVHQYDKKLVADGVIIASFCLIAATFCQPLFRFILAQITN